MDGALAVGGLAPASWVVVSNGFYTWGRERDSESLGVEKSDGKGP